MGRRKGQEEILITEEFQMSFSEARAFEAKIENS
jgi:hypothetical protein